MSTQPLISVIVPVYKVEAYLNTCVQSIVNQTYQNLEIILVDDGSPDRCPAMCDAWAERDSRIKVIHKQNGGLSDARNFGMAASSGEFLAFVDSDDWIAAEMIERLLRALQLDDSDIAACTAEIVWEDETPARLLTVQKNCVLAPVEAEKALLKETLLKQPVWYKLYRRETVRGIPFEYGKFHEDVFWSYQAIGSARRVSLIDYVGYHYLQRKGSIMGECYSMRRLDVVEAWIDREEYFGRHFPELYDLARVKLVTGCIYHGQLVLRDLRGEDQKTAMTYLAKVVKEHPVQRLAQRELKLTQRIWASLAFLSLRMTCRIRNILGIGL